jgi:hypothetical protein
MTDNGGFCNEQSKIKLCTVLLFSFFFVQQIFYTHLLPLLNLFFKRNLRKLFVCFHYSTIFTKYFTPEETPANLTSIKIFCFELLYWNAKNSNWTENTNIKANNSFKDCLVIYLLFILEHFWTICIKITIIFPECCVRIWSWKRIHQVLLKFYERYPFFNHSVFIFHIYSEFTHMTDCSSIHYPLPRVCNSQKSLLMSLPWILIFFLIFVLSIN